jgi:hypothetical protein
MRGATRGFWAVEAAVGFAIIGSALAVAIPAFVRNLSASRFVEPTKGLAAIAAGAVAYASTHGGLAGSSTVALAFPRSAPLTPPTPPRAQLVVDADGTWNDATWVALGFPASDEAFAAGQPHAFSFAFDSTLAVPRSSFVASAHADLDGDGTTSTFEVRGHTTPTEGPVLEPGMYVDAPLE